MSQQRLPISMAPVNNRLGDKLKSLRGESSIYQVEKGSGIPRSLISRYERGVIIPEGPTLKRLADFFQVNFQELQELCFEDLYPENSDERAFLITWVHKISKSNCDNA